MHKKRRTRASRNSLGSLVPGPAKSTEAKMRRQFPASRRLPVISSRQSLTQTRKRETRTRKRKVNGTPRFTPSVGVESDGRPFPRTFRPPGPVWCTCGVHFRQRLHGAPNAPGRPRSLSVSRPAKLLGLCGRCLREFLAAPDTDWWLQHCIQNGLVQPRGNGERGKKVAPDARVVINKRLPPGSSLHFRGPRDRGRKCSSYARDASTIQFRSSRTRGSTSHAT